MVNYRRLWISLALVMIISFAILGYYGGRIYQVMPPIPDRVVTEDGTELFTAQDIKVGQNVWQSIGGQEVGSIWGHGAYVTPDWNADWLHRESMFILDKWGNADFGQNYDDLNVEQQAQLKARLKNEIRMNTYNPDTKEIVISNDRGDAYRYLSGYYTGLFMNDSNFDQL
jgi:nitric oxide reductase subunit B